MALREAERSALMARLPAINGRAHHVSALKRQDISFRKEGKSSKMVLLSCS